MEKERKVTYNEIFNRSIIINALPLDGIKGKPLCDIIMLRVDYGKAISGFNSRMDEALKKLKEEKYPKFDEESGKPEEERCEEYAAWLKELEELWGGMRADEGKKPFDGTVPPVTRDILTALCEQGVEGDVTLPGGTDAGPNLVPRVTVLHMLAEMVE